MKPMPAIRLAGPADAQALATCVGAAFSHYIERMDGQVPGPMRADFAALIEAARAWVAQDGESIVGALVLEPGYKDGFYVDTVAVLPSHQGTGLGRALLQFAEDEARRHGHSSICLATNAKMTENQRFYPHIGYVETGRRTEDGYDRVFYRKPLAL